MTDPLQSVMPPDERQARDVIAVCLLVSAICNFVFAASSLLAVLSLVFTIIGIVFIPCGVVLGGALVWLGIVELQTRTRVLSGESSASLNTRITVVGAFEIATIIASNVPSMVCGILVLVNAQRLQPQRYAPPPSDQL